MDVVGVSPTPFRLFLHLKLPKSVSRLKHAERYGKVLIPKKYNGALPPVQIAYDTISRATILAKFRDAVTSLLPFARAMCARTSTYPWWDDAGRRGEIVQAEGVDEGDLFAPGP